MKHDEKNRDPERARKRAAADLRCAVRKLGAAEALRVFADMSQEGELLRALRGVAYTLTGDGSCGGDWPDWWDHDAPLDDMADALRQRLAAD